MLDPTLDSNPESSGTSQGENSVLSSMHCLGKAMGSGFTLAADFWLALARHSLHKTESREWDDIKVLL